MQTDVISLSDLRSHIRKELGEKIFHSTTSTLLTPFIHFILIAILLAAHNLTNSILLQVLLFAAIGHSIFCIGNFAHYLSHNSIVLNPTLKYGIEMFCWGIATTSPTVWKITHNLSHHKYTNGQYDSFRSFTKDEYTKARRLVQLFLSPNREMRFSPIVYLTSFISQSSYLNAALLGTNGRVSNVVAYLPEFTRDQRRRVVLEVLFICAMQYCIYLVLGSLAAYLLFFIVSQVVANGIASAYLITQHQMYAPSNENHPLKNSTSIKLPKIIDVLHLNVSHHVEHHIFPSISPKYLPDLNHFLQKNYPQHFTFIPAATAIRNAYKNDVFKDSFAGELSSHLIEAA